MTKELLPQALERMDRARAILTNNNPRPECNWGMLDTSNLRSTIAQPEQTTLTDVQFKAVCEKQHAESIAEWTHPVQPTKPDFKALVQKVHSAKGRHHNQIAMCDLYDACGLSNVRPTK